MADYTNYFSISTALRENGVQSAEPHLVETKKYSDDELLDQLNNILKDIRDLRGYNTLITIIEDMAEQLSLHFLFIFFQALVVVEERVWASQGMHPPIQEFMEDNIDLLLDQYAEFCLKLEEELIAWTKQNGMFDLPDKHAFITERNAIFAKYVCAAGKAIDVLS